MLKAIELGHTQEIVKITDEITLVIDHDPKYGSAGILKMGANNDIQFNWSKDARQVFENLEGADTIELLTVLAQVAKG